LAAAARREPRAVPRRATAPAWTPQRRGKLRILRAPALRGLPWLLHSFSTRTGGASRLEGVAALNLGPVEWDCEANVQRNRAEFLAVLGGSRSRALHLVTLKQIHSDTIYAVEEPPRRILRGDALVTATPGLVLAVQTADCIPILLADTRVRAVAAVHAGWRGTLRRIVSKVLGRMRMLYGTRPADVRAALGPGVGQCCYPVGLEVVQKFHSQFAAARDWFAGPFDQLTSDDTPNPLQWLNRMPPGHQPPPPTAQLDLVAANRWQLLDSGVPAKHIAGSGLCTACRTDLLFSHRAERGRTGRLLGAIGIQPGKRRSQ
jgi:YfiH family protein